MSALLAEQCNKDKVYSFGVFICDARMTVLFSILGNNLLFDMLVEVCTNTKQ